METVSEACDGDIQMTGGSMVRVHRMGRSREGPAATVHALTPHALTPRAHPTRSPARAARPSNRRWAHDADWTGKIIEAWGAAANVPGKANRTYRHCFFRTLCKERDYVARFFNKIKCFRRIAARFEKHAGTLSRHDQAGRRSNRDHALTSP